MSNNDEKYFRFLDDLRKAGTHNMFGAAIPLRETFDLDSRVATDIVVRWMKSFSERHPKQ